ncbi:MAG: hypothetical protein ACI308_01955 [Muribaculaceae bacterium]
MKKIVLLLVALFCCVAVNADSLPKALFVKKGDAYARYNFNVAGDLKFSNNGRTLTITGYEESINLDEIDCITFDAPIDGLGLTPTQSKERLVEIGDELNSKVNINDQTDIVRMIDQFVREYSDYDLDSEYYDVHNTSMATLSAMLNSVGKAVKGNPGAIACATQNGVELYQVSDYFGVFQANTSTREWDKVGDADYLEMSYPTEWGTCKVKLTQSSEYTDWTEVDFVGRIPHVITIVGSIDSSEKFSVVMTSEIDNEAKCVHINLVLNAQKGYKVINDLTINNSRIAVNTKLIVNDETLINSRSYLLGNELTNYENWKIDVENANGYYDEDENWISTTPQKMVSGHVNYVNSVTDILGKLQVKGRLTSTQTLYDALDEYGGLGKTVDTWDEATNTKYACWNTREVIENKAKALNNYADISFFYDGTNQMQGYLAFDTEDVYQYRYYKTSELVYDESMGMWINVMIDNPYWVQEYIVDVLTLLVFPDMTTFAIGDYFDEAGFETLVNDYNAIINTYNTISGN